MKQNKIIVIFFLFSFIFNQGCLKISPIGLSYLDFPILFSTDTVTYKNLYGTALYNQDTTSSPKYTKRIWQGVPSIGIDRNNNLYIAWFTGGANENGNTIGNYITMSISNNQGSSWYKNKIVIAPSDSDSDRFFDPSLFLDKFNNLYFSFSRNFPNNLKYDPGSRWLCGITNTKDGQSPKLTKINYWEHGVMIQKPSFALNDSSTMYFPITEWLGMKGNTKPWIFKGNINSLINFKISAISYIPLPNSLRNFDEDMIVQLSDGSFLGMIRGIDGLYTTRSKDAINWDSCTKFTNLGPTTSSRFHLRRLKSGRLILIFNNATTRKNLMAYLSEDEGKTWPYSIIIDNRNGVSYPDMVEQDGNLYISYDYDRYGKGQINLAIIKENQILTKNTNFRTIVVDSLR